MKNFIAVLFIFCLIIILAYSCTKDKGSDYSPSEGTIYGNSFENKRDLDDFEGYFTLSGDTPDNGGDSSLVVSGGCIVPHLYLDLGPFNETKELSLSTWAKSEVSGYAGYVSLYLLDDPQQVIGLEIDQEDWGQYTSQETLEVPANQTVRLEFISGGIVAVVTYFDLLEIIEN